jgi:RES domain-containing protein
MPPNNINNNEICSRCVGEEYLKGLIEKANKNGKCSYCNRIGNTISLLKFSNHVNKAFQRHYSRTPVDPLPMEQTLIEAISYPWTRSGQQTVATIKAAAKIPYTIAKDVQKYLEARQYRLDDDIVGKEVEFSTSARYVKDAPEYYDWEKGWQSFDTTIKTQARFYNQAGASLLSDLYDSINKLSNHSRKSLIIDAGPKTRHTHFYRARVFQNDESLKKAMKRPDIEVGAPPSPSAGSGRMNASGVSVFYGATSPKTAIAEVRPPVGSQVAIVQFKVIRQIKLLDLTAFSQIRGTGSIFDPKHTDRLGQKNFLKKLCDSISNPVMPDDEKTRYLPTQAIADFFATDCQILLDGILYPSTQVEPKGLNVVLFHKAAKCKEMNIPEGAKFYADINIQNKDGTERDYIVIEENPVETDDVYDVATSGMHSNEAYSDDRQETLSAVLSSMEVRAIKGVDFETLNFSVARYPETNN